MQPRAALLLGSYGQSNIGDDLLMESYVEMLEGAGFEEIVANVAVRELVPAHLGPRVRMVPTYETPLVEWLRILRRVRVVLYGGGTIYKELYRSTGRRRYAVIMRMALFNIAARILGVPIINAHIGIGPLPSARGKWLSGIGLRNSAYTVVRDRGSARLAKRLRVPKEKVCEGRDGFFSLPRMSAPLGGRRSDLVGVNMLADVADQVDRTALLEALTHALAWLLDRSYVVSLLPFQSAYNPNNDRRFMESEVLPRLANSRVSIADLTLASLQPAFAELSFFIGMRFHSLLMATATATPFLALEYDPKCSRFLDEIGYPHRLPLQGLSSSSLRQAITTLESEREGAARLLEKRRATLFAEHICDQRLREQLNELAGG